MNTPAKALSQQISPILGQQLDSVMSQLNDIFPSNLAQVNSLNAAGDVLSNVITIMNHVILLCNKFLFESL